MLLPRYAQCITHIRFIVVAPTLGVDLRNRCAPAHRRLNFSPENGFSYRAVYPVAGEETSDLGLRGVDVFTPPPFLDALHAAEGVAKLLGVVTRPFMDKQWLAAAGEGLELAPKGNDIHALIVACQKGVAIPLSPESQHRKTWHWGDPQSATIPLVLGRDVPVPEHLDPPDERPIFYCNGSENTAPK